MAIEISPAAEELLEEIEVCQPGDAERGGPLRLLAGAVGRALGPLATWVRDSDDGPGWSILLDPDRTPVPAWTGQINGVIVTRGAPEAQQRSELHNAAGLRRGSVAALKGAVAATLAGDDPQVTVVERDGSPYALLVITYADETPDAAAAEAAARSQKPAGLLLTFRVDPGWNIGQLEAAYAAMTIADIEADYASVEALESNLPT